MRVLMATPSVDILDSAQGFIPSWINSLAAHLDALNVVTPRYNTASLLPDNVRVYSLDQPRGKLARLLYYNRTMLGLLLGNADLVFCHMSPKWALPAAGYAWLFHTPCVWFRAHSSVTWQVRLTHRLVSCVATSSNLGFRIRSPKVVVLGQGINVTRFRPPGEEPGEPTVVLTVGRISPAKGQETLLRAAHHLVTESGAANVQFRVVGEPLGATEHAYYDSLQKLVPQLGLQDCVHFLGRIPFDSMAEQYQRCHVFVNVSSTGSLDKTVLEAMACGRPVVTCNEAYYPLFDGEMRDKCYFRPGDYRELAAKAQWFLSHDERDLRARLRQLVVRDHSLDSLSKKLVDLFRRVRQEKDRRAH